MDSSGSSLYSGPLSQSAQKILAALRAQSLLQPTRTRSRNMERVYGSQLAHRVEGSWTRNQEERRNGSDQWLGRTQSTWVSSEGRESSHTPACSQSSQASSISQSSYSQGRSMYPLPQAGYQFSQAYSQRENHHLPPAYQCSRALSFSQAEVSPSPGFICEPVPSDSRSRHTLSLQTPQTLAKHSDSAWIESTEGTKPCFILSLAPEDENSDETFFPRIEHPGTQRDKLALACDAAPTSLKCIQRPEIHRTKVQQENWSGNALLGAGDSHPELDEDVSPENQLKGQLLMSSLTEVHFTSAEDEGVCQVPVSGTAMFEDLFLPHSGHLGHITREVMDCDGQIMPRQDREEEPGHTVVLENEIGAGRAQIMESVHDRQNRATSVEVGCEVVDADLLLDHNERKAVYQMDEDVTGYSGEADQDEFTIHVQNEMDATLDCGTDDPTPVCRGESNFHIKGLTLERNGVECEIEDSKEISAGACHTYGLDSIHLRVENRNTNYEATMQQDKKQNWGQSKKKPEQVHGTEMPLVQEKSSKPRLVSGDPAVGNQMINVMEGTSEVEHDGRMEEGIETSIQGKEMKRGCVDQPKEPQGWMEGGGRGADLEVIPEERLKNGDEPLMTPAEGSSARSLSQERRGRSSGFRGPRLCGNPLPDTPLHRHDNPTADSKGSRGSGSRKERITENAFTSGQNVSLEVDRVTSPPIPTVPLKRKHEVLPHQNSDPPPKIRLPRCPRKWEPPRSSQGRAESGQDEVPPVDSTPKHPGHSAAFTPSPQVNVGDSSHIMEGKARLRVPKHVVKPSNTSLQSEKRLEAPGERELGSPRDASGSETTAAPKTSKLPKQRQAKRRALKAQIGDKTVQKEAKTAKPQNQAKATCLTTSISSDPRVKDVGKLSADEQIKVLEEVKKARAVVLTMVFQDGSTQLDPEQKCMPSVCGILLLMKTDLDLGGPEHSLGPSDSLLYLKLEQTPVWALQNAHHGLEQFTRDMLLQVLSGCQMVVCYKAKDFLRTVLQHYRGHLDWKRVAGCHIQDPQVSGWLLDPSDQASCYQDLLNKHCRKLPRPPALDPGKVSQVILKLCLLYVLNGELRTKLQGQGLWWLYSNMELSMIPVLASMESHRIHVDKEALKMTSDMLGTKMKQLEQDAHKAAGQIFLVTSSTQLRTVLFEKLRLHERCENKKLPKTVNKQQQSTSEATLLQLQDLHPLPKIILEYRQVHKIKSTFVDGVLSCMMSKNYISSTWYQTSAVTGRISAKHPNFQALPRQPVQITKKQYIHGKQPEVVSVHPRAMFIPQDGRTFLAADFCQVELRLLAHLSSDPELLRVFSNPEADVFNMLASQWKGVSVEDVTSEEREHAKRIVYSVVYGAGRERLSGILGVSAEQASRFHDSFLQTYSKVQLFIQNTIQLCHKQGYVVSIMGRRRTLPNIHSSDWGIRMQAERQAVNFVVQGSAADLCKMAMIQIFSHISSSNSLSARLIAQLHDELLYEVEDGQVQQFAALVKNTMESLQHMDCLGMHLKVPLKVAVSCGKSWGSMSELHVPPTSPSSSL